MRSQVADTNMDIIAKRKVWVAAKLRADAAVFPTPVASKVVSTTVSRQLRVGKAPSFIHAPSHRPISVT